MRIVAIALLAVGVAAPAFAQDQQPRQFHTFPSLNSNWADGNSRNDRLYMQPDQRNNLNDYQGDTTYNAPGTYAPNRSMRLTTPGFSLSR
jgi:hypothetical protein